MLGFGTKKQEEKPLFKDGNFLFWVKVYPNRVEFNSAPGVQSIPLKQIASIQKEMMGVMSVTIETTGGKKYQILTNKKNQLVEAIYNAQALN